MINPKHYTVTSSTWVISTWKESEYPELQNDQNLINNLDKIQKEITATQRNTTSKPTSQQLVAGKKYVSQQEQLNILTNVGMMEMAKRSTGQTVSTNTHHAIGTGMVAEAITDTQLNTEIGRIPIGSKTVVNQTERYGSVFTSADILNAPQDISEAGIFTQADAGIMILRVTAVPVTLPVGLLLTLQTNVSHQNGTEL